jgi:hypothetical protein
MKKAETDEAMSVFKSGDSLDDDQVAYKKLWTIGMETPRSIALIVIILRCSDA